MDIIDQLTEVLVQRRDAAPDKSYVASLYAGGLNRILEKIGEEATETVLAAKDATDSGRDEALIHEVADLWFHTLVMLVHLNQQPGWVLEELSRRFGVSGIDEKNSRAESQTTSD